MKKGMSEILMKQIYLIVAILSIVLVINQVFTLTKRGVADSRLLDMRAQSNDILNTLVSSTECLAMDTNGQMVLSPTALDEFTTVFSDVEPNCIRSYDYGYSVRVEKFNTTIKKGESSEPEMPIGNRDIVLIVDNSASMLESNSRTDPTPKIYYAKMAIKEFIKCANETDRISIIIFGSGTCAVTNLLTTHGYPNFVQLNTPQIKTDLSNLVESGVRASIMTGTPITQSLEDSIDVMKQANPQKNRLMILFTDGRETCCPECQSAPSNVGCRGISRCSGSTWDKISGSCCCLLPCSDVVCAHSSPNMDYLVTEKIPIYTIFLGTDTIGSQQMECISNRTGGKSYVVDDATILPNLFCELISEAPEETPEFQDWTFGTRAHSEGGLLRSAYTVTSPVLIKNSETLVQPGLLYLTVYDGQLEELAGIIRNVCENGGKVEKRVDFGSPSYFNDGKICMYNEGKELCKRVFCDLPINFPKVDQAGSYLVRAYNDKGVVEVII
ncbi:hypothetical protein A3K63_03830 [Candidatus Micrarchaeota archaeon RBG_16_49_10]|nr:MAG: hypothetical protein A3K63_03830 [Candidatus Micrarchaeota archaeon RBG_16_49_10]